MVTATMGEFVEPTHLEKLIEALEDCVYGTTQRLLVFMPPRHGKTMTVSGFASWVLRYFRKLSIIYACHTDLLAQEISRQVQSFFLESGGQYAGKAKKADVGSWRTIDLGKFTAVGIGTALTGKGGDILILDDPIKDAAQALSPIVQKGKMDWFNSTFMTRANPKIGSFRKKVAVVIIVMTLWSPHDIPMKIMEAERTLAKHDDTSHLVTPWRVLNFAAIKEPVTMEFPSHFQVEPDWRADGEALCPEMKTLTELETIRESYKATGTEWMWSSLYQQKPIPPEGVHIKAEWVKPYRSRHDMPDLLRWIRPWDLAFTKDAGDHTVSGLIGIDAHRHLWVLPDVSLQCEVPDVRDAIKKQTRFDPPNTYYGIERKHAGLGIIDDLKREGPLKGRQIYESKPHKSKIERAANWISKARAGQVHVVADTPSSQLLADEMLSSWTSFRGMDGDFDDWVDMMSIADEMAAQMFGSERQQNEPTTPQEFMAGLHGKKQRQPSDNREQPGTEWPASIIDERNRNAKRIARGESIESNPSGTGSEYERELKSIRESIRSIRESIRSRTIKHGSSRSTPTRKRKRIG